MHLSFYEADAYAPNDRVRHQQSSSLHDLLACPILESTMSHFDIDQNKNLSHYIGWSLIASIVIGILASMTISSGIDINLSADIAKTAENMLQAEERLHARAYVSLFSFMLQGFISVGLFFVLRTHGPVLATWALVIGISAALLSLTGAVSAMNVALLAQNSAFETLTNDAQRLMLAGMQVTSDYTSFHLSLVLGCVANAAVFYLFLKSKLIPKLISGWGLFASLFVAIVIVGRDFIPVLASDSITVAFMLSNLIAMFALGLYLGIKGIRNS